ncbi:endophilin-B1-like [Salarias fasciatus]|uniref:Endophilin-B1-like n=1 Tax=Salarias fasciatus TaxID=181472 RepID=A0A672JEB5_SALFA|nr:endophilin-B1-like [Salarias fasciatus]
MDLTRLAVDAGQLINRAVQYTEESLGQAERTDFDPGLEGLLARADATKTWTDQIISQTEVLLQPSPGARLEDRLYEHLEWSAPPRPRANELLGDQMIQAGLEIGSNTPYGTALLRCGEAQKHVGEAERKFVQSTQIHFLNPLRGFTEGEYRAVQNERKMLVNKRLDLDIAKSRLKKAHEADREARNLNANPLEDDYVSHMSYMFSFLRVKWLKMWAQEISQAEMELRICQSLFDRQSEITKRTLEGLDNTHINHMGSLIDFVDAQASYFAQCSQHAEELHKQLASIPAVFCSNNWQSAINNAANHPPTSNHVASESVGLDQVTPLPAVVNRPPEFNQESSIPQAGADSSSNTLPPDGTNKNNNNNNSKSSIHSQETKHHSPINSQLSASHSFEQIDISSQSEQAPGRTDTVTPPINNDADSATETAVSPPSQSSAATTKPQTADTASTESTAAAAASSPAPDPQRTNEAVKQPGINGEDVQESPSDSGDVVD